MSEMFSRNEMLWGKDIQLLLSKKHVAVIGLGGVGGFAAEALARCGIGELTLVDFDVVSESNINRQIIALHSTIGEKKTELFKTRLKDINPDIKLNIIDDFYTEKINEQIFSKRIDYVADAIDTVKSKIQLLEYCYNKNIPVITSLGAANRVDPTELYITDIKNLKTTRCKFVSNVINILDKKSIKEGITAVVSNEKTYSKNTVKHTENITTKKGEQISLTKISPGSVSFVPAVAGYYLAYYIIDKVITHI